MLPKNLFDFPEKFDRMNPENKSGKDKILGATRSALKEGGLALGQHCSNTRYLTKAQDPG
jgi:hypothetical protein